MNLRHVAFFARGCRPNNTEFSSAPGNPIVNVKRRAGVKEESFILAVVELGRDLMVRDLMARDLMVSTWHLLGLYTSFPYRR